MTAAAAKVLHYRTPRGRNDATAYLGLVLFLGSWAMMFAALFFAYAAVRIHAGEWPPVDAPRLPLLLPGINTLVIGAGSVALQKALAAARTGRTERIRPAVGAALLLGVAFLSLQGALWLGVWRAGLRIDDGPYPSVFWALTVFHALHVLVGLGGLSWVCVKARAFGPARHVGLRLWTAYWHFVGAVWLVMYLTVFVL